ncbi:MAG TPA: hypothetical protein VFK48_18465 [Usitatibacter sp.]|nr:hypothetical protein [Usitatibacter sp.]
MSYNDAGPGTGARGPMKIVILVRRIDVAVLLSVIAHAILFALPARPPPPPPASASALPLQVVLVDPPKTPAPPTPPEERVVPPPPRPVPKPLPRPAVTASAPRSPAPSSPVPVEAPAEEPSPAPTPAPPAMDMLAMIEARRAGRRASDSARPGPPSPPAAEDAATRNLRSLTGGEGVGGVFQVLEKGTRRGTFAFNGWRPESRGKWRTVIEVEAPIGEDIELAMVRRMIQLIREYYTGDFRWESHRLGRVVTLSARLEDSAGLEDFMMKEMFDSPPPARRAGR